jgi:hypothetical protein
MAHYVSELVRYLVNLTSLKFLANGTPKIFCTFQIEEGYVAIETYSFHIKCLFIEVHRKYITFQQPLIDNTNRENENMKNLHRICFRGTVNLRRHRWTWWNTINVKQMPNPYRPTGVRGGPLLSCLILVLIWS